METIREYKLESTPTGSFDLHRHKFQTVESQRIPSFGLSTLVISYVVHDAHHGTLSEAKGDIGPLYLNEVSIQSHHFSLRYFRF